MKKRKWFLITCLSLGLILFWHLFLAYTQNAPKSLTLLYSNNINGEIDPCPSWGPTIRFGGLARRKTWVDDLRQKGKDVLLLDAGDLLFGKFSSPYPKNELDRVTEKASLIVESFNLIGYHAAAVGDDDLSLGKKFLVNLSKKANFPFLSSNLIDQESGKLLFAPSLLKESNGLRIGIFSLLSPDAFISQTDFRKTGLIFLDPIETAKSMVAKLKPQTDLIILLSHLGHPKDVQLAQTGPGIHIIAGSHSGIQLINPPVIQNAIIIQTSGKGMYGGRFDLTMIDHEGNFYNTATQRSLERNLLNLQNRLTSVHASETEKLQLQKAKEETEKKLEQLQGRNHFTNTISPLDGQIKDDPEIKKRVDTYKAKFPEKGVAPLHDSRGNYTPKTQ